MALAQHLAGQWARQEMRITLIGADLQGSAVDCSLFSGASSNPSQNVSLSRGVGIECPSYHLRLALNDGQVGSHRGGRHSPCDFILADRAQGDAVSLSKAFLSEAEAVPKAPNSPPHVGSVQRCLIDRKIFRIAQVDLKHDTVFLRHRCFS
jgi:hypothetical protein